MDNAGGGINFKFDLKDNSPEAKRAAKEACEAALEAIGLKAEKYAKQELRGDFGAPPRIDTGNLRNSVSHAVDNADLSVYIGTNVEYAPYVHEGTKKMAPNRFLRNASQNHLDEYKAMIEAAMK